MAAAGGGAHAAAVAAQLLAQEEEEEVTPMNSDPTGAVEYKILRSVTAAFRKPEVFRAALDEEAQAGWELVEKLDDKRLRLRRSVAWRERDAELTRDPYRIKVGMGEGTLAFLIVLSVFGTLALIGISIAAILVLVKA